MVEIPYMLLLKNGKMKQLNGKVGILLFNGSLILRSEDPEDIEKTSEISTAEHLGNLCHK